MCLFLHFANICKGKKIWYPKGGENMIFNVIYRPLEKNKVNKLSGTGTPNIYNSFSKKSFNLELDPDPTPKRNLQKLQVTGLNQNILKAQKNLIQTRLI